MCAYLAFSFFCSPWPLTCNPNLCSCPARVPHPCACSASVPALSGPARAWLPAPPHSLAKTVAAKHAFAQAPARASAACARTAARSTRWSRCRARAARRCCPQGRTTSSASCARRASTPLPPRTAATRETRRALLLTMTARLCNCKDRVMLLVCASRSCKFAAALRSGLEHWLARVLLVQATSSHSSMIDPGLVSTCRSAWGCCSQRCHNP